MEQGDSPETHELGPGAQKALLAAEIAQTQAELAADIERVIEKVNPSRVVARKRAELETSARESVARVGVRPVVLGVVLGVLCAAGVVWAARRR